MARQLYCAQLTLTSATATGWAADTVFGHLCWQIRYHAGESTLAEFLELSRGPTPPLVLSNGFPGELLPRPLGPRSGRPATSLAEKRASARVGKEASGAGYLTREEFARAIAGEMVIPSGDGEAIPSSRITLKNQINRATGTTGGEGQLYELEETFWPDVRVYALVDDGAVDLVREAFQSLAESGYGKRKSVGYGHISAVVWEPWTPPAVEQANGFVSLSHFVPAGNDPTRGYWRTITKYGKLGEAYAFDRVPFKRPVVMLAAGSVFYDDAPQPAYGRLVAGVMPNRPEVVHHGYALAVPCRLPSNDA